MTDRFSDSDIAAMLYNMVNEHDPRSVPMGALYDQIAAMLKNGVTNERVFDVMAQLDRKV
jgi:hypothetical protein